MLSQWNRKRYLIYQLVDTAHTANGAFFYTIGPGGDIVLDPRPDKLEAAYMRQLNASPNTPVDYRLRILDTYENYSQISLKHLQTWTQFVFFDPGFPQGKLYPWPVMQGGFELHIITKQILQQYSTPADLLNLPQEYEMAIYYNLVVRLGANYRLQTNPAHAVLAKDSLDVLRGANSQISSMSFPRAVRAGRYKYNIYSDNN